MFPEIEFTKQEKPCRGCGITKAWSEFYVRSGFAGTAPGHYNSECKSCMKKRGQNQVRLPRSIPHTPSETLAINYLTAHGIPTLPGKAVYAADVDIVSWGCVWIEVKYALLKEGSFTFTTTPRQIQRGFLAHIVLLICDYGSTATFHLFRTDFSGFYRRGKLKTAFMYTPQRSASGRHSYVTSADMETTKDRLELIETTRLEISAKLIAS